MKKLSVVLFAVALLSLLPGRSVIYAQQFSFAYLSDIHIAEGVQSVKDLEECIADINKNKEISFAIFAGDMTEFGADREIVFVKSLLDNLNKPYYVVAGNHDAKWSESGCNTFVKVFGYEHFNFDFQGIKFIGTNSGPNMRMAPALMPRESVVWLDSLVKGIDKRQPVIFVNHYPMDTSILNYTNILDILKNVNIQLIMNGHWHQNRAMVYEGIPGVIGRSSMRVGKDGPGYNIVKVDGSTITFSERIAGDKPRTKTPWHTLRMSRGTAYDADVVYPRGDNRVNQEYPQVKPIWKIQDKSDIGAGAVMAGNGSGERVIYANTSGKVYALSAKDGSVIWEFSAGGKIYSTPAVNGNYVVFGCADGNIYAVNLISGKEIWKYKCNMSVLGSPVIYAGNVYIGASDHCFRAISLKSGKLIWSYDNVKGFIEARPFVDNSQVVIGDWGNTLYSFNPKNGNLQWCWSSGKGRMYSPAAVFPVKANGRIFIVTPQRVSYAIDAKSGEQIWCARGGRESIGLSSDKSTYYIKTMLDTVFAYKTTGAEPELVWGVNAGFGYEIAPTPVTVAKGEGEGGSDLVFVPTDKGNIIALNGSDGSVVWKHKLSNALINYIEPVAGRRILVSTMDGFVAMLQY